jgi:glycosyltransferase involved in cell wall biosynthesis
MARINVFANNLGWLFEDLKQHFSRLDVPGMTIVVSDEPRRDFDAWVALRTGEAHLTPDLARTAVCIHDLFDKYQRDGSRRGVFDAGGLIFCHPHQRTLLEGSGVLLDRVAILERPIGALASFAPADRRNDRFSIGWVGRNHPRKRVGWFIEALTIFGQTQNDFDAILIGAGLHEAASALERQHIATRHYSREQYPIAEYPRLYRELNVIVITSTIEAGPLPLFEALASGLAVVSTSVGWAPWFSQRAPNHVRIAATPHQINNQLGEIKANRDHLFRDRFSIARLVGEWSLESWLCDVIQLAATLA